MISGLEEPIWAVIISPKKGPTLKFSLQKKNVKKKKKKKNFFLQIWNYFYFPIMLELHTAGS